MKLLGVYDYTIILTYMSLISAVTGMTLASAGRYTAAILCLLLSGLCDAFDGTVARSKKNRTEDEKAFGIQLDSLCDVVSFGVFPAMLCYHLGMQNLLGRVILCLYCICGVMRLAYFNVQEGKRQQIEEGGNKSFRGIPITSASIILPVTYCFRAVLKPNVFIAVLHIVLVLTAFLFVLDFRVPKPDVKEILSKNRAHRH